MSTENPAESERDRPQERAKWFMRGRMVDGKPGAEQLHRAYDQKLNNRRLLGLAWATAAQGTSGRTTASPRPLFVPAPAGSAPWNFLGPAPTSTAAFNNLKQQNYGPAVGRVTAVAVDQGDTTGNTVYIGGASGGVWKTTNAVSAARTCDSNGVCTAPVTWAPLTDGQATLTVGSIALQPGNSNLILVGSGEANNSADSYYGLGILRSTDAGATWSLISSATCPTQNPACAASGTVSFHGLGFTHIAFSTDAPSRVVATAAAASGGISVGAETGGSNARGIYFSTDVGITWTRAKVTDDSSGATQITPDPGSANAVIYNAQQHKFYANLRFHGVYSSADGATWTRLANQPANITLSNCPSSPASSGCPLYRAEMAIVSGRDEMYVWVYNSSENDIGIFQTKDGGQSAWTQISTTGIDNCGPEQGCGNDSTGQGTYNIALAAVPNGTSATDLYAGGVNEYKCAINPVTNATCTTSPFLNLTHVYGCSPTANIAHVHPDEHGVDFLGNDGTGAFFAAHPTFSPPVFFGNDGGVYRVLQSSSLTNGTCPASGATPASPFDNLSSSTGFSMIQFVGFSQAASDATTLVGGTQDNGSPAVSSASPSTGNWLQVNNGDGGFNAINPLNANEWFTSNPAPLTLGGGIQRCATGITCTFQTFLSAITQNQIGSDNSSFYTFFTLDPQASGRMLVGSCRVWRGNSDGSGSDWSSGGGSPLSQNFDTGTTGSGATCGASTPFFVNTITAGGPCNGTCDPGATPGTSSGGGSQVVWAGMEGIADSSSAAVQCPNGLPCGGQVWVTTQADADLSTTPNKWSEVSGLTTNPSTACTSTPSACNINPKHYNISGIALDPKDATGKTAYVTVMGFGVGHIFKTTDAGVTWAKLDGDPSTTGLPDAPADAVVADPSVANLVYIGTDVGAFQSIGDGTWTELGPSSGAGSLPNVTITQLKIYNNPSDSIPLRLRASTYGRGIWEIPISTAPGFQLSVTPAAATSIVGQTATLNGTITLFNGYNSSISISCQPVGGALPSTCTANPPTLAPGATTFTVTVGDSTAATFNFKIVAVGGDPKAVTQQFPVTLNSVIPFSLGAAADTSAPAGGAATTSFTVTASTAVSGTINVSFACSGLPAGAGPCGFSPAVPTLSAGQTASVSVTIPTASTTPIGSYSITITGTYSGFSQTTTTTLSVTTPPDFTMSALSPASLNLSTTDTAASSFTLLPNTTLSGTVSLSCTGLPTGAGPCAFTPASPSLTAGQTTATSVQVTLPLSAVAPGTYTVAVNASVSTTNGVVLHSQSLTLNVTGNSWGISAGNLSPTPARPGQPLSGTVTITPSAYTGTVSLTCALSDSTGTSCGFSLPSSPTTILTTLTLTFTPATSSTAQTVNVVVTTTVATPATNQVVTVTAQDTTTSKSQTFNYSIIDYALTTGTPAAVIPNGASGSTQIPITIAPLNGFNATVNVTCTGPSGSGVGCSLNPPGPNFPINGSVSVPLTTATISGPNCTNSANSCGGSYAITIATSDSIVSHSMTPNLPVLDFRMTPTTTTGSVTAGQSGVYTIAIAPGSAGATGSVTVSCTSGVPSLAACQFGANNASSITLDPTNGQVSTVLTVTTTAPSVSLLRPPSDRHTVPLYAFWLTLPGIVVGIIGIGVTPRNRRGKLLGHIGLVVVLGILLMLASCGGGGGGSTTTPPIPKPGTPAGTYQITVTGASGSGATSLSHFTQITLQVN
ncbi:MAG: hypothetical protein LAN70_09410 [Acidobacteriia bacterium]|nr:hypothetical protein [Terriglobia bacterium]